MVAHDALDRGDCRAGIGRWRRNWAGGAVVRARFMLAAAVPVHQFLLIGPIWKNPRCSICRGGFALLLAAGFATMSFRGRRTRHARSLRSRPRRLEHNLAIWRNVAMLVERTCAGVARARLQTPGRSRPRMCPTTSTRLFPPYGFRPCVEWAPASRARVVPPDGIRGRTSFEARNFVE